MRSIRDTKGFTLIELMIVVVIIGILAAVALPKFSGMSKAAKESEADPLLKEVYTLQQAYYTRFARYASGTELAQHGFDINLSDVGQANTQQRYYYLQVAHNGSSNTAANFCATAELAQKGVDNGLQRKSMGETRSIRVGAGAAALGATSCD
jgi:prepilin-type N-terminal cleavage/methylation domain-containing protein